MGFPIRASQVLAAWVVACATVGCGGEVGPAPDRHALVEAVVDAIVSDSGSAPLRVAGGRTAFDSLIAGELLRRGGRFVPPDDSVDVTRVETEGVSFRGDTAVVPVRWATCDHTPGTGFTWWATWVELRCVPQARRGPTRSAWREVEAGGLRLEDGWCNGEIPPDHPVEARPPAG